MTKFNPKNRIAKYLKNQTPELNDKVFGDSEGLDKLMEASEIGQLKDIKEQLWDVMNKKSALSLEVVIFMHDYISRELEKLDED